MFPSGLIRAPAEMWQHMLNITHWNSFLRLWDGFVDKLRPQDVIGASEQTAVNFYGWGTKPVVFTVAEACRISSWERYEAMNTIQLVAIRSIFSATSALRSSTCNRQSNLFLRTRRWPMHMQRSLTGAPYATSIQSVFSQTMTHACNVNTIERTSGVSNKSKRH